VDTNKRIRLDILTQFKGMKIKHKDLNWHKGNNNPYDLTHHGGIIKTTATG
jgi:hypothetical protein